MYLEENKGGFFKNISAIFGGSENAPKREKTSNDFEFDYDTAMETIKDNEESTDKPMRTRTVDFSHLGNDEKNETSLPEEQAVQKENPKDLDILFATNFIEKGGKFIFAETMAEAIAEVKELAQENSWDYIYHWEDEIKEVFNSCDFQKGMIGYTIEKSDAAMSLCEVLIAQNGNIFLTPQQASFRRMPMYPKTQLLLVDTTRLAFDMHDALAKFAKHSNAELPSVLDLRDNQKGQFYFEGKLILKAEGSTDIYLILVDELLPTPKKTF